MQSRHKKRITVAVALIAIGSLAAFLLLQIYTIRTDARWLLFAGSYKAQVQSQPRQSNGELKHIEWGGWGWAGQDTTVFLVYDPSNELAIAAQSGRPGKYNGLPCEVYRVHRLESQWYTVQFYTNTYWDRCTGE